MKDNVYASVRHASPRRLPHRTPGLSRPARLLPGDLAGYALCSGACPWPFRTGQLLAVKLWDIARTALPVGTSSGQTGVGGTGGGL